MATLDPEVVELAAPEGDVTARFAVHAGTVGCSLRHHGEELLGLGGGLAAYLDHGAVFGIPLLYPWANRLGGWSYEACGHRVELERDSPLLHGDEHCLPIHGALAAASDWRLVSHAPCSLVARLDFAAHLELLAIFPFPHVLELAIALEGGTLTVVTTVIAGGSGPVPLSFGFHPYLAPPGAAREDWWVSSRLGSSSSSTRAACRPALRPITPLRRSHSAPARTTTCSRSRRAPGSPSPPAGAGRRSS
jgi:aldose 1-epimerase